MNGNPFVIEEAEISLTLAGDSGIKVWIGGCASRLTLTDEFDEVALQYQGEPYEDVKQTNEKHKIEIENVWLLDTSVTPALIPLIKRGQVMNMVIVWFDEDTYVWNKRTYYNVTGQIQRIGDAALQNLTYRAQTMLPESGVNGFDLAPGAINQVIYVDGTNRIPFYRYNPGLNAFTAIDSSLVPALAEIVDDTDGRHIFIQGQEALVGDDSTLDVVELIAIGSTVLEETPRLEFWLHSRVGTVTKSGKIIVGNVSEEPFIDPAAFVFGGAHLGLRGLYAPQIAETL